MTLQKASIQPLEGSESMIEAMFNPDLITYTKQNNWTYQPTNGQALPGGSFASGVPATLAVTLIFDGTEDGENVAKIINKLTKLTKVDDSLDNGTAAGAHGHSQSQQHRPPKVSFMWGNYLSFDAVISKVISRFTLFLDDGTPVRASVDVTFTQIADENVFPSQNPTSGGRTGERIHRLAPQETLDQVAYASFGQTGLWRALAAFNGIDDPLRLQAGDAILLPAGVDDLKRFA
jgi:Contractile injection system tube protein